MRLHAAIATLLLAVPAAAPLAQERAAAAPARAAARAPRSGVLLGVAGHGTLWIAPDSAGRLRVLGPSIDLIVRRDTTFWRIAVVDAEVREDSGGIAPMLALADPSGVPPALPVPPEAAAEEAAPPEASGASAATDSADTDGCADDEGCEEPGDWFSAAIIAAPADAEEPVAVLLRSPAEVRELRETEGARDLAITFAGGGWVAWTEYLETTGPAMTASNDARLLSIDSIAARPYVLGDARSASPFAFDAAAVARHRRECAAQYERSDSRMVDDEELFSWPLRSFFLQHLSGRWRLVERFSMGTGAMRGFLFDCLLSDAVPEALVGHDRLAPSWKEIRRQIPAATDAISSPSGDLVVVTSDEWLRVYAPRAGRLGAPLADLPLNFPHIVMAQWADPADVPRWTEALAPLLEDEGIR